MTLVSTASIPAPTNDNGIAGVQFDAASGTTGGATNRIIIGSNGNGLYVTTNAGSTWAAIAGVGTAVMHGIMASDQNYYMTSVAGTVYRVNSSNTLATSWTTSNGFQCFAVNPANPAQGVGLNPESNPTIQSAAINGASAPTSSTNFTAPSYSCR